MRQRRVDVAAGGMSLSAAALGPAGRPVGDDDAGHPLGGGEVGPGPDGLWMVTVRCCYSPVWRAGS